MAKKKVEDKVVEKVDEKTVKTKFGQEIGVKFTPPKGR
jgi:hypothetical protein